MTKKKKPLAEYDKYDLYQRSVQSPEMDIEFIRTAYQELKKKQPRSLREDFCGTHLICCHWVKSDKGATAYGIDLDPEPIEYGQTHYWSKLTPDQQKRVHIQKNNVLNPNLPKCDVIAALNFSYFTFKDRPTLKLYLEKAYETLNKDGLMIMDCFGGSQCYEANEEETEHDEFSYYWDQDSFDPVTNFGQFYIHFKRKGERKREKVFSYDWRLWSLPEIRDIMDEVGFRKSHIYWEGTTGDGEGDGNFIRVESGEDCESWVSYIVGEK